MLKKIPVPIFLLSALLLAQAGFSLWGLGRVPFHPDESTYLFMSADLERLFNSPGELAYAPDWEMDLVQHYRLVDPPLIHYLTGLGRRLAGKPPLPVDWDWSASWETNQAAGALPDIGLLIAARLPSVMLLTLSLLFIYMAGRQISGAGAGLLAALLLGTNALALLHGRRAMAESALIFGFTFGIWAFLNADQRPWLAGLALGLAFSAKQSALGLLPAGLLAAAWAPWPRFSRAARNLLSFLVAFILLVLASNPLYWRNPLAAWQTAWSARQELVLRQATTFAELSPEKMLKNPVERGLAILAQLYLAPPSFKEVTNYAVQTEASEQAYLANPLHNLLRSPAAGGFLFFLTLLGVIFEGLAAWKVYRSAVQSELPRAFLILALASLGQVAALAVAVPFIFQRYIIPLIPLSCLWIAIGIIDLKKIFFAPSKS